MIELTFGDGTIGIKAIEGEMEIIMSNRHRERIFTDPFVIEEGETMSFQTSDNTKITLREK